MTSFKKKGGSYRAVILGAVDEDTFVVPAGMIITNIVSKQNTTTDGNLTIGTVADGDEIVEIVALGTVQYALADHTLVGTIFSLTADQTCHINISSATNIDLFVTMQKVD
jgi:hypothetical protein